MKLTQDVQREVDEVVPDYEGTLVERLADKFGATVRASTIYGEPVEREGVTVIPVAKAAWGFGGGMGRKGDGNGGGGGGGARVTPVGFIELSNGGAKFRRIRSSSLPIRLLCCAVSILLLKALLHQKKA